MDVPTKKRKETTTGFANKKPRLHLEAVNQNQIHNAEKNKKKAQKRTHRPKAPWTKEEDEALKKLVEVELQVLGDSKNVKWTIIGRWMGVLRSGKQCRERWYQHLRPGLVKGEWTAEEDALVKELHEKHGNKWATIAAGLPHRTDNDIKNRWNSKMKSERIKARTNSNIVKKRGRRDEKFTQKTSGVGDKMSDPCNIPEVIVTGTTTTKTPGGQNSNATYQRNRSETPHSFTFILRNDDTDGVALLEGPPLFGSGVQFLAPPEVPPFWSGLNNFHGGIQSPFPPLDTFSCTPLSYLEL